MEKFFILKELKDYIKKTNNKAKDFLNINESDIEFGESQTVVCRKFKYTCKAVGEKFANDIRFPVTKTFDSDAKWFYNNDKNIATNFLIAYLESKELFEELGGVFDESDILAALDHDAFFKLRAELKMYQCRVLPETVRIEDYEEIYFSSRPFTPIYFNTSTKKKLLGYVTELSSGEKLIFDINSKHSNKSNADIKPNWLIIAIGIFYLPVLIIYLIYYFIKKKKS